MNVTVFQIDNRDDKVLHWAIDTVIKSTQKADVTYSLELGEDVMNYVKDYWFCSKPYYFLRIEKLAQLLNQAKNGDILIYMDTDMVVEPDGVSELIKVIKKSNKSLFITAHATCFNGGLFAVKVNPEIKTILESIIQLTKDSKFSQYMETKFGERFLPCEIPFIESITHNLYNICNFIEYLNTEIFNARPEDLFNDGQFDFLKNPTKKTLLTHYMTQNGYNMLVDLSERNKE